MLSVSDGDREVGIALVGRVLEKRLAGRTATLLLNQSGDAVADRVFVEYNGVLAANPGVEGAAMHALLGRHDWRALRLAGIAPDSGLLSQGRFRRRTRVDASPARFVDLDAVRDSEMAYLSLVSSNTRNQIRRAMKERIGEATVTRADPSQAAAWLEEMHALNGGRHADNAWDDPTFRAFCAELVARGHGNGEVDLIRVEQGGQLLGLLLNFVYRGRAMNYQSAFVQPLSGKDKPGLLAHAAAVGHYAARGQALYSFLAGKDRYKESLSTGTEQLEWWVLERFSPRLEAEALVRRLLRRPASV